MTGLRARERDATLPERLGQPGLRPLREEEVARRVVRVLLREGTPHITDVHWDYARWKPGVSLTCAYQIVFADGKRRTVVCKRYADGKARSIAGRRPPKERIQALCDRMRACAVLADEGLVLWTFPYDRILSGLASVLDRRFLARAIERAGIAPPRAIRRRRLEERPVRYKPERRAVWRVDADTRGRGGRVRLAARVLPPPVARRVSIARRLFQRTGGEEAWPKLLAADEARGILLEDWLEVEPFAPDSFESAYDAGGALARLHAVPVALDAPPSLPEPLERLHDVFSVHARLAGMASRLGDAPLDGSATWVHGDFHPDQVASARDGEHRLLDLDRLGRGDRLTDLASWIADHLVERDVGVARAAYPLIEGYREAGGAPVERALLWMQVALELARRAASAIRRLERDALERAEHALATAIALSHERVSA